MERNALLREVFDIPEVVAASDFVLQLHTGVDHASQTVADYVATKSLAESFDLALGYVGAALSRGRAQGVFLHGSFGAGKSHFMAVLDLMLRGEPEARAIKGLQSVVAKHSAVLNRRLLTAEYHLIGAKSLEEAVFSGFAKRIAALHPDATAPMLHKSDRLFEDAAGRRKVDEQSFFETLNAGKSTGGWGSYGTGWTSESYDRAAAAAPGDPDRNRLAEDLQATMFTGYAAAGEWLDISDGLAVMAGTAKNLGYEGLVLFLDELVLWLASHANDATFVASEASKVAKLVESGVGKRAVPIVSFVARQRELSDFVGDKAAGVQRAQVGQAIKYWEERFDTITLSASNLPDVAHKRLLMPTSPQAGAVVAQAVAAVKHSKSWDILLQDEAGSDEGAFAKVYPFSPALVDVLVELSGRLQRERTALKVMAHLLCERRETGRILEVIGVGDLYDVMIASGEQPLNEDMRNLFTVARSLFDDRFTPVLLGTHGLTSAEGLPADHPFHKDARLAKTLIVAALVPDVKSLSRLTAHRLAALNHGTVSAWIPGEEGTAVLSLVRTWAQQIGELHIGEGGNPVISVELSGVDYDSVLAHVEVEDTPGKRRQLLARMLFAEMGVPEPAQLTFVGRHIDQVWRGTKRRIDVVFGNIRDESALPDATFMAEGDRWKLIVDYPFDSDDHGPQEDVGRFDGLRVAGKRSRTVGWVPYFLTAARQRDLGKLVQLEHLLGGNGGQFDANAAHLPVDQRAIARQALENLRNSLTETIKRSLRQAYGIASDNNSDVDRTTYGEVTQLPTLWQEEPLRKPTGATLQAAVTGIVDQMLSIQYPNHPIFDSGEVEIRVNELKAMWEVICKAAACPGGRLDPVEQNRRDVVRRLAEPLLLGLVGPTHFVFDEAHFGWHKLFLQAASEAGLSAAIPVSKIYSWLESYGLTTDMANLIIGAFALLQDKQFQVHGAHAELKDFTGIRSDMVLVDPRLPTPEEWQTATERAAPLFGIEARKQRTAANLGALARELARAAADQRQSCRDLVAVLLDHAATLNLTNKSIRLVTARQGTSLVEGLCSAGDDLARVVALARVDVPAEPEALARSMSSAGDLVSALRRHDWTTLNAVAEAGDAGDESANLAVAGLRKAAAAEELHSPLLPALAAAHAAATQWLLARTPVTPRPTTTISQRGAIASGSASPATATPDPAKPLTNPDEVRLTLVAEGLADRMRELESAIEQALATNPGRTVRITWRLQ